MRRLAALVVVGVLLVVASRVTLYAMADGHRYQVADAPGARVVIVPGSQVRDGYPQDFLRGRLDTAIDLLQAGTVTRMLLSGNGAGNSGDEVAAMRRYLQDRGIPPDVLDSDPEGVTTNATCQRAHGVFGVEDALIVTQDVNLARTVALCRAAGLRVNAVVAPCDCATLAQWRNVVREWLAAPKALAEMLI